MTIKTRFAPSPTGKLHVGNARVALLNWLFTRQQGGQFMLRLDDTDEERSTEAFADGIRADLDWLGLGWDSFDRQSARYARYTEAFERLRASGHLYPCYETPEELELKRKVQLSQGKPPLYDRAALHLTDADRAALAAEGRTPHWRFRLDHAEIRWTDMVRGAVQFHGANLSDPVLYRADGRPIYSLASVVDDIDHAITHVIRGEDHVANTAVQIQVCAALGGTPPAYGHLPLITGAKGEALSKRLGSLSLEFLRDEGIEAMAINSLLARLGSADPIETRATLAELMDGFDIGKFGRATPKFDIDELKQLNARLMNVLPFAAVDERLAALGLAGVTAAFWEAVRPNLGKLADLRDWWTICTEPLTPVIEEPQFTTTAAALLPEGALTPATWSQWTDAIKAQTGRKGKQLFLPLRLALTGQPHGPELPVLLPLLGREKALARLLGKTA
jgi:glutamyl-tRNA synthetase